jgi:hypothetical protein
MIDCIGGATTKTRCGWRGRYDAPAALPAPTKARGKATLLLCCRVPSTGKGKGGTETERRTRSLKVHGRALLDSRRALRCRCRLVHVEKKRLWRAEAHAGGRRSADRGQWHAPVLPSAAVAATHEWSGREASLRAGSVGRFAGGGLWPLESENLRCITAQSRAKSPASAVSLAPWWPYICPHTPRPFFATRQHTDLRTLQRDTLLVRRFSYPSLRPTLSLTTRPGYSISKPHPASHSSSQQPPSWGESPAPAQPRSPAASRPAASAQSANGRRSKEKMHINVVVIGHVDSGKSTTTGRKPSRPRLLADSTSSHGTQT